MVCKQEGRAWETEVKESHVEQFHLVKIHIRAEGQPSPEPLRTFTAPFVSVQPREAGLCQVKSQGQQRPLVRIQVPIQAEEPQGHLEASGLN